VSNTPNLDFWGVRTPTIPTVTAPLTTKFITSERKYITKNHSLHTITTAILYIIHNTYVVSMKITKY